MIIQKLPTGVWRRNFSTYNTERNFPMISRRLNDFQVLKWNLKFIWQYLSLELFKRFNIISVAPPNLKFGEALLVGMIFGVPLIFFHWASWVMLLFPFKFKWWTILLDMELVVPKAFWAVKICCSGWVQRIVNSVFYFCFVFVCLFAFLCF